MRQREPSPSPRRRDRRSRSKSISGSHSVSVEDTYHHCGQFYERKRKLCEETEKQTSENRNDGTHRSRIWTEVNSDNDDVRISDSNIKNHRESVIDSKHRHRSHCHSRRRSRSSSSSELESSANSKSETRRHKRKYEYEEHSYSDKKRHKKKEKKRKKNSKSKKHAVNQDEYGKYGILRESDFHSKSVSFQAWLRDVKEMSAFNGPKWEKMELFKEYMEDYNTCTMPHKKYYDIEKYEMKSYEKQQRKALLKRKGTSDKARDQLADEDCVRRERLDAREKKEQEEFRLVLQLMDKDKIAAMREQERVRAQMQLCYKSGNIVEARRLEQILNKVEEDPRYKR